MPLFYTKKGDKGYSHIGKQKIDKTCVEIEALGQLDELNSLLGLIKSLPAGQAGHKISGDFKKILHDIQENLFVVQANVAAVMLNRKPRRQKVGVPTGASGYKVPGFNPAKLEEIEKIIDKFEKAIKPAKKFVIAGANPLSAWLDYARARSRNVERAVLKILKDKKAKKEIGDEVSAYLNRLSSLLFAMARMAVKRAGIKERHPTYK